jgi:hypothetical protein
MPIFCWIEKQTDLTLDEVVLAMRKHKIAGSRTAVWRFFSLSVTRVYAALHKPLTAAFFSV